MEIGDVSWNNMTEVFAVHLQHGSSTENELLFMDEYEIFLQAYINDLIIFVDILTFIQFMLLFFFHLPHTYCTFLLTVQYVFQSRM